LQLQPEWFYRVSSLALDLLTLGSLAGLEWKEPLQALVGRDGHASGRGADLVGSFEGEHACILLILGGGERTKKRVLESLLVLVLFVSIGFPGFWSIEFTDFGTS